MKDKNYLTNGKGDIAVPTGSGYHVNSKGKVVVKHGNTHTDEDGNIYF